MKVAYVSTLTKDYILGLKVFIKSILENNPATNFDYVILEEEPFSELDRQSLLTVYKNFKFKTIQKENYSNISFSGIRQWRVNPANRLHIFTLDEYDKIIFFDIDMLCTGDISALHTTSGDFLACYHPMANIEKQMLGFEHGFNCGVMVIDKKFLNQNTIQGIFKIMKSKKWLGNQSAFNLYFKEIYKLLPNEYFLSTPFMNDSNFNDARIYHFAGDIKPWNNLDADNKDPHFLEKKYCLYVREKTNHILLHKLLVKYNKFLNYFI